MGLGVQRTAWAQARYPDTQAGVQRVSAVAPRSGITSLSDGFKGDTNVTSARADYTKYLPEVYLEARQPTAQVCSHRATAGRAAWRACPHRISANVPLARCACARPRADKRTDPS